METQAISNFSPTANSTQAVDSQTQTEAGEFQRVLEQVALLGGQVAIDELFQLAKEEE